MATQTKTNALSWFEIYAADFDRARRFYETILDEPLTLSDMPGGKMALFPFDQENGIGGAITAMEGCTPSGARGTMVYLNVDGKLDAVLQRIPEAGGKIVQGRMPIPPHGFIAFLRDSEGNHVGLHSMS